MTGIVNILGVIGEIPDENGDIITPNTTFLDVVQQVEANKEAKHFDVVLSTPGGYVEEGNEIYNYLIGLKSKGITVNTIAKKVCASIGTKIFLAGTERFILGNPEFMIHNPFGAPKEGDADYIESYYKELRSLENDLINFYSTTTGTSKEAIKPLMKNETFLTSEQAVQLGFATGIRQETEVKAVAFFKNQLNKNKMSKDVLTKDEAVGLLGRLEKTIKGFLKSEKPKNKLVQDANGEEIDFPDLEADDTPTVGDKANIDGSTAEGERLMPNGETYVFVGGELTEIKEAEGSGEEDNSNEEMEALQQENTDLKAQLKAEKEKTEDLEAKNQKQTEAMKSLKKDLKKVKASIGSDFKHEKTNKKNLKKETESRSVFKNKEE